MVDGFPIDKLVNVILTGSPLGIAALALLMWFFQRQDGKEKDRIIEAQYKTIVDLTRESVGGLANVTNAVVAIDKSISRVEALVVAIQSVFASHASRK
jgi:hypothetical protein